MPGIMKNYDTHFGVKKEGDGCGEHIFQKYNRDFLYFYYIFFNINTIFDFYHNYIRVLPLFADCIIIFYRETEFNTLREDHIMEQKRISRLERILDLVHRYTARTAEGNFEDFTGLTASDLAGETGLDRANVSKELNRLYHQGLVVKCQGKPTIFLHQAVLAGRFPGVFIPGTIPCVESLTGFLLGLSSSSPAALPGQPDCLEAVIGSRGSMKKAVLQAKAAVSYPPCGLHTLILGSAGIGKQRFARTIFEYAQTRGLTAPDGKFVVFNCQDYSGSPQLLMAQIFGYGKNYLPGAEKGRHGLIEQARGGIFCLDGVHKLSPKVQELLITLIEKNTFSRMGESSITRQGELMIVATSTEPADSPSIQRFVRNMPILIRLPGLSERSPRELLEHLVMFFGRESQRIRLPFRIHKDVLSCMVQAPYPGQIGEVKGCVKGICSMAYLEHITGISPSSVMEIGYRHLPLSITEAVAPGSEKALQIRELMDRFRDDYVQFSPDGPAELVMEEDTAMDGREEPVLELSRESLQISDVGGYISRCMDRLQSGASFNHDQVRACFPDEFCKTVEAVLASCPPYDGILQNPRLFYGFMLHLYNALRRQKEQIPPSFSAPDPSDIRRTNPREYGTAVKLREALNGSEQVCLPDCELSFIAMYLYLAINWTTVSHVHFLVVFHGEGVSQGISDYLNRAVKQQLVWGINCGPGTALEDVLRQAEALALSADQGAGILIFGDTEPFTGLHTHITQVTGIRAETIGDASMERMLQLVKRAAEENCSLLALMSEAPDARSLKEAFSSDGIATSFLNRIIHEVLTPSLTFLNPGKAVDTLLTVLSRILNSLSMEYSDEIALKFIFHCAHMMERVIKGEPLKYPHLKNFINQNNRLMAEVERQLGYAEEVFGVPIPAAEKAYAAEIFLPFVEEMR